MNQNLLDLNYEDLKLFLSEKIGVEEKKLNMRTQQIFNAVYQKGLNNFEKFTTIPIDLRKKLLNNISLNDSKIVQSHESTDGTRKFLVEFFDGNKVECVYIPEKTRGTICVSSQVGCSLTCRFCRSGTQKLVKNNKYIKFRKLIINKNVSKVSIVGVGMVTTPGITYRMFKALAKKKINIEVISTSEIKISVLIDKKNLKKSVEILHQEFKLNSNL